jgi:uncharacterized repeat protein (TIGR01451 family)
MIKMKLQKTLNASKGEKRMKELKRNKSSAFIRGVFAIVILMVFWITMTPFSVEAALQGSAGNTIIRNTVTVNYKDNNGNAQAAILSTIDLTVTTVAAAPTVLSINPSPGSTDGTGATQAYTVRVRTNSNGPGAITFNAADGSFTNIAAGAAPTLLPVSGSIFLGSTVIDPSDAKIGTSPVVPNGGTITFAVPNDGGVPTDAAVNGGATGDGVLNALKSGDIVYIYTNAVYYGPFTVGTVTDPAVGASTTAAPGSVQLTNSSGASITLASIAYGWEILEAKDVTVTVTEGAVTDPTAAASWVTTITATMGGLSGTNTVTTNALASKLAVQKYVRNVTAAVVGGSPITLPAAIGGATYYMTGVSGKPGDWLEYAVKITDAGTGNATAVIATDPVPTYSTLVSSSGVYGANNTGGGTGTFAQVYSSRTGTTGSLKVDNTGGLANVGYGKAAAQTAGSTMTFYLGLGSTNAAGGTVNSAETDYVIYQIKID